MRKLWLGFLALLAACDDGTVITHVGRNVSIDMSDLVAMQQHGGIPTEIHGTPFAGASAEELASALRPPARAAQVTRWQAVEIGSIDHGYRMILHFNPDGPPNSQMDCRLTKPAETRPPQDVGFTVNMTFCKGNTVEAHGYLQSRKTRSGDFEDYARVMKALMNNIFSNAGNDR
ncbi:hypothetical protein KHP62_07235 [Rhodobacteraceae bacterium NNCM2]|nr:hypothetical protein [Coraliihabitans acroporae]